MQSDKETQHSTWTQAVDLVLGRYEVPGLYGSLQSDGIQAMAPVAGLTVGLGAGWSGRNTSACFAHAAEGLGGSFFGLFVGEDKDERTLCGSAMAAVSCREVIADGELAGKSVEEALTLLLKAAHEGVRAVREKALPREAAFTSDFSGYARDLKGVAVSGCVGHLGEEAISLLRVGGCSVVSEADGSTVLEADMLTLPGRDRFTASWLSGLGLEDLALERAPLTRLPASESFVVCTPVMHALLEDARHREGFGRCLAERSWGPLGVALENAPGWSSRAFLRVGRGGAS